MYTGTTMPGITPGAFMRSIDSEADRYVLEQSLAVRPMSEMVTQPYALGREEQKRANALAAELTELVDEGIGRFVTGEKELNDENYQAWLDSLHAAGSGELLTMFEQAQNAL